MMFNTLNTTNISSHVLNKSNSTVEIDENLTQEIVILTLYLITTIVALIGNFLVCKIIFITRKVRNTTYILIANLAISDIMGALTIPGQWIFCATYILDNYSTGDRMCASTKSLQIQSYYVSTFTMTAIAIDRYRGIKNPLKSEMKPKIPIIAIWLFATAFTATTTFSMRVSAYFASNALIGCRIVLPVDESVLNFLFRKIRIALLISTQYLIPLTISSILYICISRMIWNRRIGEMTASQVFRQKNAKWRTIKMLIIVVVMFAISWLPLHIIHFIDFYVTPLLPSTCNSSFSYMFFYWLAISSCSFNPFIYFWLNPHFRRSAIKIFCYCNSFIGSKEGNHLFMASNQRQSIFYISSERQVSLLV